MDKPQSQPPAPPPPQPPRPATYSPLRTPNTPSCSPSYSDNTDSTIVGYVSTMISWPARPRVGPPQLISRRPHSDSGYYSMASVGDTTAPMASAQPAPGPQYRGDEHAQYQEQIYQLQQQQHPYYSQYQQPYQQPYRQPSTNSGQYRHSTATAEEGEIQSPQPLIDGYNEFHEPWTNDRRRYAGHMRSGMYLWRRIPIIRLRRLDGGRRWSRGPFIEKPFWEEHRRDCEGTKEVIFGFRRDVIMWRTRSRVCFSYHLHFLLPSLFFFYLFSHLRGREVPA